MSEPYIGEIIMFGGNFAPRGWMLCQGQLLSIAQNTALFSILGTTYGGDGRVTFALPDLRGRFPMQQGQGPGLSPRVLGEQGGEETITLISSQMPAHNHTSLCSNAQADASTPEAGVLAADQGGATVNYTATPPNAVMNPLTVGIAGGSQPHDNMAPFLALNFIIAVVGIFPSRN